jgi:hypothetical protein
MRMYRCRDGVVVGNARASSVATVLEKSTKRASLRAAPESGRKTAASGRTSAMHGRDARRPDLGHGLTVPGDEDDLTAFGGCNGGGEPCFQFLNRGRFHVLKFT